MTLRSFLFIITGLPVVAFAQTEDNDSLDVVIGQHDVKTVEIVRVNKQQCFPKTVTAGNYSGITFLGDSRYALVNDKADTDGFIIFRIDIDTITGQIQNVTDEGFRSSKSPNRDMEGVAYFPYDNTLFVSGEKDNRILEYDMNGMHTGRELQLPSVFGKATSDYGLESLTYNATTHRFWTTTESTLLCDGERATYSNKQRNRLRLQSFGDDMQPKELFFYETDEPTAKSAPLHYAMGVSDLCALDDGKIIVLEREFLVPKRKLGAFVNCKLYVVDTRKAHLGSLLEKTLLLEFKTTLTVFNHELANYEGICVGPKLADGNILLIMISDSQNGYKGVLKDWFKTIVVRLPNGD